MKRREFIAGLGSAAAWPVMAWAQQPERIRRIGVLMPGVVDDLVDQGRIETFVQALEPLGWTVGRNLQIDARWAAGDTDLLRRYATELVAAAPDVILASTNQPLAPLRQATRTVPIVFAAAIDPVGAGNVASLARPGGNATGFLLYEYSISGKWLELIKHIVPGVTRVAVLRDPATAAGIGQFAAIQAVAPPFKVELSPLDVRDSSEIEQALTAFAREPNGGLIVPASVGAAAHRKLLVMLAARHRLPAVYVFRGFVADGGLISYGPDLSDQYRRAAGYVDRILKGEKPADLPVQAPTKYELVINLKTAKSLGLDVPASLLARADEVIECDEIGVLSPTSEADTERQAQLKAFRDTFAGLGWIEGRNVAFEYRWTGESSDLVQAFAKELVALAPDLLLTQSVQLVSALRNETRIIPILFGGASDPIEVGLVESLARPGGNITGFMSIAAASSVKYLELIKELDPRVARVLVLMSSKDPSNAGRTRGIEAGGPSLKVNVSKADVLILPDIERAISDFAAHPAGALIILPNPVTNTHHLAIIALAAQHRVPAIYQFRYLAAAGGLVTYGADQRDQYSRAASYADRILKGEKPGDLPIQTPTKFELVINLKTAKALSLDVPPMLLARADEVIE